MAFHVILAFLWENHSASKKVIFRQTEEKWKTTKNISNEEIIMKIILQKTPNHFNVCCDFFIPASVCQKLKIKILCVCAYIHEEESGGVTTKFGQKFCAT